MFEEAATVFFDEAAVVEEDPGHYRGETRMRIIGRAETGRVLVVVYVESQEAIRIISARKASPTEEKSYDQGW